MSTIVDNIYSEYQQLVTFLDEQGEISLRSSADHTFRKALLLAAASYFEKEITSHLINFCYKQSQKNSLIVEFVKNKGLKRQYHTLFAWDEHNANSFFGLFGEDFKKVMKAEVSSNDKLELAIVNFLQIGSDRNRLVHQDYGTFVLEKTADEIFTQYQSAVYFVSSLPTYFNESTSNSKEC